MRCRDRHGRSRARPVEILINNAGITRDAMFHKDQGHVGCVDQHQSYVAVQHDPSRLGRHARAQIRRVIVFLRSTAKRADGSGELFILQGRAISVSSKRLRRKAHASALPSNAICPGYIATDMVKAIDPAVDREKKTFCLIFRRDVSRAA